MKYNVHLISSEDPFFIRIREVEIPPNAQEKPLLEQIFYYGQNEFQPVAGYRSVSAGDVVELDGTYHLVAGMGFEEISKEDFESYKLVPRDSRFMINSYDRLRECLKQYRVTYFSAFQRPQHMENLYASERDDLVREGKEQQYKVVVSDMTDEPPTSF